MHLAITASAMVLTGGAVLALWRAWRDRRHRLVAWLSAAGLVLASSACWIGGFGPEIGIPLLLETWALAGFAFILTRLDRRPERAAKTRVAPRLVGSHRQRARGAARIAIAGPLGFIAAVAIGTAIATRAPFVEQTRLIGAGLLVPSLWAGFVGWTLVAKRLLMPAASLATLGALGFGIALIGQG